jgi:hypothetical protein
LMMKLHPMGGITNPPSTCFSLTGETGSNLFAYPLTGLCTINGRGEGEGKSTGNDSNAS